MAKVVISGFLEATLHQKREYVPMFRDHRTVGAWLPKTMYTTKFQESGFRSLASFDRDVDLTTGSLKGVVLNGEHIITMDMSKWTSAKKNPDGSDIPGWLSKPKAELPTQGKIGLQGRHAGAPIWFRNIKVKVIE